MAVAYKAVGTLTSGTSPTASSVAWPAGFVAGDFALLLVQTANSAPAATPSGWTVGIAFSGVAPNSGLAVYYRIATGGDAAPSVTTGAGNFNAQIVTYSGAGAFDAGTIAASAASTTLIYPSITTTVSNALVVLIGSLSVSASMAMSNFSPTTPTGFTQELLAQLGIYDALQTVAGPTGTNTSSLTASQRSALATISLSPTSGVMNGSASMSFTASGNLTGNAAALGSASFAFTANGTMTGRSAVAGVASITYLVSPATLTANGAMSGVASLTYTAYGALVVAALLVEFSRDGLTFYKVGAPPQILNLSPGDYMRVTYTSTPPTLTMIPR